MSKKLSSSTPTLNYIGAEISIALEGAQMHELIAHHLPGKLNTEAHFLSRGEAERRGNPAHERSMDVGDNLATPHTV